MGIFRGVFFLKKGGGLGYSITLCEILVAIVFCLENSISFAKSDIFLPKCTKEGRWGEGPTGLGNIPKKLVFWKCSRIVARMWSVSRIYPECSQNVSGM